MIILFLMVITLMSVATNSCPVDCSCSTHNVPIGQYLSCNHRGLEAIPLNLPNDTYKIVLYSNNFQGIPSGTFANMPYLHEIDITSNKISTIDDNAFGVNPSVQILKLYSNMLPKIEDTYFKNLRNLTYLDLSSNLIFVISNKAFKDLVNLKTLRLENCKLLYINANLFVHNGNLLQLYLGRNAISTIEDETFGQLVNLKTLNLEINKLRELNSRLFSNLSNLQTLDVQQNLISNIEDYTFINQNKVELLRLNHNSITSITPNTYAGLERTKRLYMNNIHGFRKLVAYSFRDLPDIDLIELSQCDIVTIETNAFYNLTGTLTLNIRNNRMVEIQSKAFAGLTGVEKIDLENNNLKTIRTDTFIDMPNLNVLILQGNDIQEIEENAFGELPALLYLSLVSNNLICSCMIRPFYLWLLQQSGTVVDGAICSDMNGQLIKKLSNVTQCIDTTTMLDTSPATTSEETTTLLERRTGTFTTAKTYKNTIQTTYQSSVQTSKDKSDTSIAFLQVTLLGVIAFSLATIALTTIVSYIIYRTRCRAHNHNSMYDSNTTEKAVEIVDYDVVELPDLSTNENNLPQEETGPQRKS